MDYQSFVDSVDMPCCVMSVEKKEDGTCGEIRIMWANPLYRETMGPAFYEGMLYSDLVPKDNKFEDYCYRAAVLGQRMHAYVETRALGNWTDQTIIPLKSDREDIGYCQFIFEFTQVAEPDRMAMVSISTAEPILRACIALMGSVNFEERLGEVLDIVLEESGASLARIMLLDHEKKEALIYCERVSGGFTGEKRNDEDAISYEMMLSWERMIGVSNSVIVRDESDMDVLRNANPEWVDNMRAYGVERLVLIPLRRSKKVLGYLYVVNFEADKVVDTKEMLEHVAFFLGSEIYNHMLVRKLIRLSSVDALTGLNNRRAMIERVNRMTQSREKVPYGVVNIDLNGLKLANDISGHDAGDRMLIQAGEILRKVFYEEDLYRTGGDEFIVINSRIERDVFEKKVRRLRSDIEKNGGISFAIGSCWSDGSMKIKDAFREADRQMYQDKKSFYEKHQGAADRPGGSHPE